LAFFSGGYLLWGDRDHLTGHRGDDKIAFLLITRIVKHRKTPYLVFAAGLLLFLGQSLVYIHQLPSTLDEGNYLYKGWLFVTGVIQPFQPYGVWTNKMPLAFLIPGAAQALFGPGLLTGGCSPSFSDCSPCWRCGGSCAGRPVCGGRPPPWR
jgi:hypothetical protein